jgi:hypothetical protein
MTKRERILQELYNTDLDAYVAKLTEDWSEYDWSMFNKAIREPLYDEWNDVMEPSYYDRYIKNA